MQINKRSNKQSQLSELKKLAAKLHPRFEQMGITYETIRETGCKTVGIEKGNHTKDR